MMRALLLDRPGPPSSLRVGEASRPVPGVGEVLVRVTAVGLNPVDYQLASGGHPSWTYPHVPGLDIAGVVEDAGPGPDPHLPAGTRVVRGQDALVQGASGGVGGFAVQLLAAPGVRVTATASPANHAYVRGLGAGTVLDYRRADLGAALRAATAEGGFDAVVDTVSSASAAQGLLLLRHGGGLAAVAGRPSLDGVEPFGIAPSLHEIALGAAYTHGDAVSRADLALMLTALLRLVAEGALSPLPIETVRLADASAALERLAGRHVRGKIVVRLDGPSQA